MSSKLTKFSQIYKVVYYPAIKWINIDMVRLFFRGLENKLKSKSMSWIWWLVCA